MFEITSEKFVHGLIERANAQVDQYTQTRRGGYDARPKPITAKDRYPHRRRIILAGLAFGLCFHMARKWRRVSDVASSHEYDSWSEIAYQGLLSGLPFSEVQQSVAMHRRRSEWDQMLARAVETAEFGVNKHFDPVEGRPRQRSFDLDDSAFISYLQSDHPSGSEDPYSFWYRPFLPERLHYVRLEGPSSPGKPKDDVVGYAVREAYRRGIK